MLDQPKIDLVVLLKLFQHAENGGEAETPREITNLFRANISQRRIEIALKTLESRREVENVYHPHYFDEGLWQISGEGLKTVEKALKIPTSFIARYAAGGDEWLESNEAQAAVLSKNQRYENVRSPDRGLEPTSAVPANVPLQVNVSPVFNNPVGGADEVQRSSKRAGWFGAWGGWAGAIIALLTLLWILHEAKVF